MEEKDFLVEKVGRCVVITMGLGENRMNPNFTRAMNKALDQAERYEDATCLVTIGVGKWYSLGFDLEWRTKQSLMEIQRFVNDFQKLIARLITFPMVTVAALNGHTYAGGGVLAVAHDYLIMRDKKGWFCFSEVRVKIPFPTGILDMLRSRLPHAVQHEALVLGRRYTAEEALEAKIINKVCSVERLKETAIEAGLQLAGKDGLGRNILSTMKRDLHKDAYRSLMQPAKIPSKL